MKKQALIYLFLLFLILAVVFIAGSFRLPLKNICARNYCIKAEIASTDKVRQKGLMFRRSMPQDHGMLFVFDSEGLYEFWMKNTRFPLDMIWIDSAKKIVDIYEYALPCKDVCKTITPKANAQFVLEVNAGFSKKHGMKIGDILNF